MPSRFDELTRKFVQQGDIRTTSISAGVNGQAVLTGLDYWAPYGWIEKDKTWRKLSPSTVSKVGTSQKGRLYKIDAQTKSLF